MSRYDRGGRISAGAWERATAAKLLQLVKDVADMFVPRNAKAQNPHRNLGSAAAFLGLYAEVFLALEH